MRGTRRNRGRRGYGWEVSYERRINKSYKNIPLGSSNHFVKIPRPLLERPEIEAMTTREREGPSLNQPSICVKQCVDYLGPSVSS